MFYMFIIWLGFALLFVLMDVTAEFGTTPNLKQIVIGRCFEYVTLANLNPRYNCEKIWQEFEMAVVRSSPCDVRVKDYQKMFQVITQTLPCGKLLFWSKTRDLMHSYVAVTGSFWTLEDTLLGFMFNDLIWCGQQERERGFDYQSCPKWSACLNHPVYSLWKQASQNVSLVHSILLKTYINNMSQLYTSSQLTSSVVEMVIQFFFYQNGIQQH
uniref:ADP-ribosyl cyclase/cyclic ADP-ribose hydrolase n=1 Tax=Sinocyclocheilus anshuiensis TaxID=1608454 RepID=A0A671QM24_9TELE